MNTKLSQDQVQYLNAEIMKRASKVRYIVSDHAPGTFQDLRAHGSKELVIWSGASDTTIYQDAAVNHAFRAIHDLEHLKSGLGFTIDEEIELARRQASQFDSDFIAELVYAEIAGQAEYFKTHGEFPANQVEFVVNYLKSKGVL